jgi:hypothetical protein
MNFNIWTANISVAFKIIVFFYTCTQTVLPHVKKNPYINILAVQMLKFIDSFYNLQIFLKSTVHVHVKVWYCKMCIFVVLCVDETYYLICWI